MRGSNQERGIKSGGTSPPTQTQDRGGRRRQSSPVGVGAARSTFSLYSEGGPLVLGRGRRRSISGSRRELLYFWIACFGQLLEAYKLVSRPILGLKDQIDHLLESV
jgi:hypothetical protein